MTKVMVDISDLFDFADAAKKLGIKRPYIYYLVQKHKLIPLIISGTKYLSGKQVGVLKTDMEENGRKFRKIKKPVD